MSFINLRMINYYKNVPQIVYDFLGQIHKIKLL